METGFRHTTQSVKQSIGTAEKVKDDPEFEELLKKYQELKTSFNRVKKASELLHKANAETAIKNRDFAIALNKLNKTSGGKCEAELATLSEGYHQAENDVLKANESLRVDVLIPFSSMKMDMQNCQQQKSQYDTAKIEHDACYNDVVSAKRGGKEEKINSAEERLTRAKKDLEDKKENFRAALAAAEKRRDTELLTHMKTFRENQVVCLSNMIPAFEELKEPKEELKESKEEEIEMENLKIDDEGEKNDEVQENEEVEGQKGEEVSPGVV